MLTILVSKTIDHHDHSDYQDHVQAQNDQLNQDRPEWEWRGSSCSCSPPCLRSGCSVHSMWARIPAPDFQDWMKIKKRFSSAMADVDSSYGDVLQCSQTDEYDVCCQQGDLFQKIKNTSRGAHVWIGWQQLNIHWVQSLIKTRKVSLQPNIKHFWWRIIFGISS